MEMPDVDKLISDVKVVLTTLEELKDDYNTCKSDTSKKYLFAAINKFANMIQLTSTPKQTQNA